MVAGMVLGLPCVMEFVSGSLVAHMPMAFVAIDVMARLVTVSFSLFP